SVTLTTNPKVGLPTPTDEAVFVALLNLALADGELDPRHRVEFVPNQLIELMHWSNDGRSWKRLKDSILRLYTLRINYKYAWFDHQQGELVTDLNFALLPDTSYTQPTSGKDKIARTKAWVMFGGTFCDRINKGALKPLDLGIYFSLDSPVARRMYRVTDRYFPHAPTIERDLRVFAHGHIGLSPHYTVGQIKQKLSPAIAEHERRADATMRKHCLGAGDKPGPEHRVGEIGAGFGHEYGAGYGLRLIEHGE
ncbi:MAG: replication initiator protein A, partial [Chloroflexi bacterium]|nr:replication initiator protein A [Chloroflexota bacterium]